MPPTQVQGVKVSQTSTSEPLQEMQRPSTPAGDRKNATSGPHSPRSQLGFHRWPQEGGLLTEATTCAGALNVAPALDISLLSRQEVPSKELTGLGIAKGLSQVRAGGGPRALDCVLL